METGHNVYKRNGGDKYIMNHLFYMVDLKLYNSKQEDLKQQIKTVYRFSNDIDMQYNKKKATTNKWY